MQEVPAAAMMKRCTRTKAGMSNTSPLVAPAAGIA
jgi:hypothetical protein